MLFGSKVERTDVATFFPKLEFESFKIESFRDESRVTTFMGFMGATNWPVLEAKIISSLDVPIPWLFNGFNLIGR